LGIPVAISIFSPNDQINPSLKANQAEKEQILF
jgi:hypothetical protein